MTTGAAGYETYDGIEVDQQGNMYVTTETELIKFSADRAKLWSVKLDDAWQIDLDAAGNVYVTGEFFGGTITVPGVNGNVVVTEHGRTDLYLFKFNPEGKALWGRVMGGAGDERAGHFAVDGPGNVYIGGMFFETSTFGDTQLTSAGVGDGFISKLTTDGDFIWTRAIVGRHYESVVGVDADNDGNVYITGSYYGQVSLPGVAGSTLTLDDPGTYSSTFVAKLNTSGEFVWAHGEYGGTNTYAGLLKFDPAGSIVLSGRYLGPVDFDPGPDVSWLHYMDYGSGGYDLYVVKLNLDGQLVWAKSLGGDASEFIGETAIGPQGQIFIAGTISGEGDFDPSSFDYFLNTPGNDAFLAALDSNGEFISVRTWGGPSLDSGIGVANDAAGNVYVTGKFYGQTAADFDPGPGTLLRNSVGTQDGYLMKFKAATGVIASRLWNDLDGDGLQEAGEPGLAGAVVELFATTDATIDNLYDGRRASVITDETGEVRFEGLASGNYFIKVHAPIGFAVSPLNVGNDDDDAVDSDLLSTGTTALITLQTGEQQTQVGFGLTGAKPEFGIAAALRSAGSDTVNKVVADRDGNLYVAGSFQNALDFDPGPATVKLTPRFDVDAFVAKYTATGALVWVRNFGHSGTSTGVDLAVDDDGNVVVAVDFSTSIDADPSYYVDRYLNSRGSSDSLLVKLDQAGTMQWYTVLGGNGSDNVSALTTDAAGNLLIAGSFSGTRTFDPLFIAPDKVTSAGSTDAYVLKLTADGRFMWVKTWGGTGADAIRDLAVDADGNIVSIGNFAGTVDFDPAATTLNLVSAGNSDAFISKLTASGGLAWAKRFGNSGNDVENNEIAVDADGNVFAGGAFQGTFNFGGSQISTNGNNLDGYVAKWNAAGQLAWVRQFGGSGADGVYGLTVDAEGAAYATGSYTGTAYFSDPTKTVVRTSQADTDAFVQKWASDGKMVAFYNLPGSGSNRGNDVNLDPEGLLLVGGNFTNTADLDPTSNSFSVTAQGTDGFITKFRPDLMSQPWISLAAQPVTENQGMQIVGQITLHDLPLDDPFTLQLFQTPAGVFTIEDGNLLLADTDLLDYEMPPSLTIGIRATSQAGRLVEQLFTITLQNANERPTIAPLSDALVTYGSPFTRVGSFTDPDAGDTWTATVDYGAGGGVVPLTLAANRTFTLSYAYANAGKYPVTVTVTDAGGLSHTRTMNVEMAYLPLPTLVINGNQAGVRGETLKFEGGIIGALPAGVNTITWNFGDGSTPIEVPITGAWQNQSHIFTDVGDYKVTMRLQLADGRSVTQQMPVEVTSTSVRVDQADHSFTTLVIGGTTQGDVIRLRTSETGLQAFWQRALLGTYKDIDRVIVYGQAGNDFIMGAAAAGIELWSFGGSGNDFLIGSDGHDVLMGDSGNDLMIGRGGRDLSVGGSGSDVLLDDGGDDIQIAGTLTLPDLPIGLGNIMREWTSTRSFVDRVNNLKGDLSGTYANDKTLLLVNQTVFNDNSADFLWGGSTSDWFFADENDDLIADHWFNDFVDLLE
ncbi:PKD domain-containing protein [Anatilimnocola floriformis]|uniref:PKD domain-containing protein n=1 Tax=Anatilimnocola floriformis TaxID=2948575 RepID=UPI0020C41EE4|nr:PKD domain-containing protein [Anatilimnocola floriformis]